MAEQEIVEEIVRRIGRLPLGWPIDRLIGLRGQVAELLAGNHNRPARNWNIRLAGLARIMLQERAQARRVDDYNREQQRKK